MRADVRKGIEIIKHLRGHTSGYGIPQFVIDAPGGGGKIPINPEYVQEVREDRIIMRNFQGERYEYPIINDTIAQVTDPEAALAFVD